MSREAFDNAIAMARSQKEQAPVPEAEPAMANPALAHGRAIAGAKALHAVGHITAKERDRHMKASKAAIRKPFGSWDAA